MDAPIIALTNVPVPALKDAGEARRQVAYWAEMGATSCSLRQGGYLVIL